MGNHVIRLMRKISRKMSQTERNSITIGELFFKNVLKLPPSTLFNWFFRFSYFSITGIFLIQLPLSQFFTSPMANSIQHRTARPPRNISVIESKEKKASCHIEITSSMVTHSTLLLNFGNSQNLTFQKLRLFVPNECLRQGQRQKHQNNFIKFHFYCHRKFCPSLSLCLLFYALPGNKIIEEFFNNISQIKTSALWSFLRCGGVRMRKEI